VPDLVSAASSRGPKRPGSRIAACPRWCRGFQQDGGKSFLKAFDAFDERRQSVPLGEIVDDSQNLEALTSKHQARGVEASPQFVVGLRGVERQEDKAALGLALESAGKARCAGLELLAGVGLEARAALHEQAEGVVGSIYVGGGLHWGV
jgi:hypothetical protein